ncbi:hypothetical protein O3M35_007407 [Rhynocoris fuscipes]|uniref:U3 small nucleolar RNA-associated protein 14 homolog A n=1 Tax=Rhynocoris fuscipes TaxID=488301 RepID=A0AAW1DF14_9HEMI
MSLEKEISETDYLDTQDLDTEDVPLETHNKLLNAVSQIYKKQRINKPLRREPTSQISEFNLTNNGEHSKKLVHVKELVKSLNARATHHEIRKKVQSLQRKSKPLPKPMEKIFADRIRRKIGYSNLTKQLTRWEAIVERNRASDQLKFPLQDYTKVKVKESNDFLKTFKEPTDLEKEVAAILQKSEIAQEEKEKEEELFPLSLEEIIERRKLIAHMRARESYKMAKAYRQNKIKSKKYHRILKREKIKKELKDFEILQKTNPEAALEKLERIERARAEERITLRHKNTGKWARSQAIRAKYDSEARAQLAEQLAKSRELTKKLQSGDTSSEDEQVGNESDEENLKIDASNPWQTESEKQQSEIDSFLKGYEKYKHEKSKDTKGNDIIIDNSKITKLDSQESSSKVLESKEPMDISLNHENINKTADNTNDNNGLCDDQDSDNDIEKEEDMNHDADSHEIQSDPKDELSNVNKDSLHTVSMQDDALNKLTTDKELNEKQTSNIKEYLDNNHDITVDRNQQPINSKEKNDSKLENLSSDLEENRSVIKEKRKNELHDLSSVCESKKIKYSPKSKTKEDMSKNISKELVQNCISTSSNISESSPKKVLKNQSSKLETNKIDNTVVRKKKKLIKKCSKIKTQSGVWAISTLNDDNKEQISKEENIKIDKMFDKAEYVLKETLDSRINQLKVDLTKANITEAKNIKNPKYKSDLSFKSTNKKPDSDSTLIEVANEGVSGGVNDVKSILNVYESGGQLNKNEPVPDIDPNKFLPVKPSKLNSGGIDFVEEHEESAENELEENDRDRQLNLEEAFADDDVVEEFRREKEEEVEKSKPKTIDLSLPGWGNWAGHNISQKRNSRRRKTRRLIVKFPEISRKDEKKDYVIINEELNPALKSHMVHDLPFPFTSVKDYETSIRAPIGNNWVPRSAFMKLINPAVVTKLGAIIEPMKESELLNKSKKIKIPKKK